MFCFTVVFIIAYFKGIRRLENRGHRQ